MSTIDDRIVNMEFNNSQFQDGISETNKSLNDLQKNLQLDGATSGLNSINAAANNMDLGNIAAGVEHISSAFSVLGVIGINILSNITQSAISAGKNIAGAILDPIIEGGNRRALAIEQAKFQFRGLGLDIEATMAASKAAVLGTAYGLDDAATAAAQFGASGITAGNGLYETLRSIAGVSAQTGSNFSDIARIFQGIAGNGRVYGNDLLSLGARGVNAAALLAKSMGTSEEAVRKMVSEGKISFTEFSDVMLKAFGDNATKANETFTGALSNMKAALSRIGANSATPYFESLRVVMNALTPVIDQVKNAIAPLQEVIGKFQNAGAAKLAEFLGGLDLSKYTIATSGFIRAFESVYTIITRVGKQLAIGFKEIFPAPTVGQIVQLSERLAYFFKTLEPTGKALVNIHWIAKGFFALISIGIQVISGIVDMIVSLITKTSQGSTGIGDFAANIGKWLVKMDAAIKSGDGLTKFFKVLGDVIAIPIGLLQTFFGILADGWDFMTNPGPKQFQDFLDDIGQRFSGLAKIATFFKDLWSGIVTVANGVWQFIQPVLNWIGDKIKGLADGIGDFFSKLDFNDAIAGANAGLFIAMLSSLVGNFKLTFDALGGGILAQIKLVLGGLTTNLKALEMNTNAKTLKEIAIAVALLAASALVLSMVDTPKMLVATGAILIMVQGLMTALDTMSKMTGAKGLFNMLILVVVLNGMATAIFTLAAAVALLALVPLDRLIPAFAAIILMLAALTVALQTVGNVMKTSGPQILAGAAAMMIMAQAVFMLVTSVVALAFIPLANLGQGVGAVVVLLLVLVGVLALLGQVMKKYAAEIILGSVAMLFVAEAVLLMAGAVAILSAIGIENLAVGLGGLAIALGILVLATKLMGDPVTLIGAAAMILVAVAITILAGALKIVATMSWDDIGRTMVVLAGALVILAAAAYAFTFAALGAAAMIVVAAAIVLLVPALLLLGTVPFEATMQGLGILVIALGTLAVVGLALIPASVGFLLLGAGLLLLGTGILFASIGIGALAVGIALLTTVGAAGIAMFTEGIKAFAAQIPMIAVMIGQGMVAMAVTIGESAPELIGAFVNVLMAMLEAIETVVPKIIEVATVIIVSLVEALVVLLPLIVDAGLKIITGILEGIADNIGGIVTAASNIIINFLTALSKKLPDIIAAGGNLILSFINGMADYINKNSGKFVTAGTNLFNAIIDGIAKAIEAGGSAIRRAGEKIGNALIKGARNALGIASPSKEFKKIAGYSIEGLTDGMAEGEKDVEKAADSVGKVAIKSVTKSMQNIASAVSDTMDITPTIRPVLDLSAVKRDSTQISDMFGNKVISLDGAADNANATNFGYEENRRVATDADGMPVNDGSTVNFTQINNSPKPISEVELYRNTKNLLSVAKGELDK